MDVCSAVRTERAIHAVRAHGDDGKRARNLIEDEVLSVGSYCPCACAAVHVPATDIVAVRNLVIHIACRAIGESSVVELVDLSFEYI